MIRFQGPRDKLKYWHQFWIQKVQVLWSQYRTWETESDNKVSLNIVIVLLEPQIMLLFKA